MDWCSMVDNSMMGIRMYNRNWVSILIQLWFGVVGIFFWISIQGIERNGLAAINLVPELA